MTPMRYVRIECEQAKQMARDAIHFFGNCLYIYNMNIILIHAYCTVHTVYIDSSSGILYCVLYIVSFVVDFHVIEL